LIFDPGLNVGGPFDVEMRLLLTNTISQPRPLPRPLPPLTLSWFYDLSGRYKQGTLFEPASWLNCWHDFFCAKNIPGFCRQLFVPLFCFNEFLSSLIKLCFRISNPLLLHSSRRTPSIEPQPAKFLHTVCQRFCQPSEPCSDPCFSFCTTDNGERGWGGGRGVKCERVGSVFNHEFTPIGPHPKFILFNPLHCYKKFIHAAGDHHWSRQNIRLVRTGDFFKITN
jgi:hypothetical protein